MSRIWRTAATLSAIVMALSAPAAAQDGPKAGQFDHLFDEELTIDIEKEVDDDRVAPPNIAVATARLPDGEPGELGEKISEVARFDFEISALFSRLDPGRFPFEAADGFEVDQIQFSKWQGAGARYLVKTRYKVDGDSGESVLEMRLFDVQKRSLVDLEWASKRVPKRELRGQVHSFVNAVIGHMTGTPGAFGTPMAISVLQKDQKHIEVMDHDGGNRYRVSTFRSINVLPSWGNGGLFYTSYVRDNPDLYFFHNGETRLMSAIPGTNHGAAFCGGKIAVTLSMGGTNTDIYLLDAETGRLKARLTDHWGIDTSPTWGPDCSKIAFVSDRGGTPQIYLMDASGDDQRRLTFSGRNNTTPTWSPTGDEIAFTGYVGRNTDVFITNLNGFIRRVTHTHRGSSEHPTWSPDGRYLAFVRQLKDKRPQIFITPTEGFKRTTRITLDDRIYGTPSWKRSPLGQD